jgi:hypothetical protein
MSKFLVNLLLQISKALVNSKIQFLFGNSFPCFRPGRPHGPFGLWPSQPTGRAIPQGKIVSAGPSSPRVDRVFTGNTFSLLDHAFPSRPPLPRLLVNRAPPVRFTPFPRAGRPRSEIPHAAAPPRRCPAPRMPPSFYNPPSSLSPLNPLQTEH